MNIFIRNSMQQIFKFLLVSSTGWLIDFSVYLLLTEKLNFPVGYSNFISGIPALTFVFFISTRKIFGNNINGISLKKKYIIYFVYQMLLVALVSIIGQYIYVGITKSNLYNLYIIKYNLKIIVKIIITPITMILNFCVMKILSERY